MSISFLTVVITECMTPWSAASANESPFFFILSNAPLYHTEHIILNMSCSPQETDIIFATLWMRYCFTLFPTFLDDQKAFHNVKQSITDYRWASVSSVYSPTMGWALLRCSNQSLTADNAYIMNYKDFLLILCSKTETVCSSQKVSTLSSLWK